MQSSLTILQFDPIEVLDPLLGHFDARESRSEWGDGVSHGFSKPLAVADRPGLRVADPAGAKQDACGADGEGVELDIDALLVTRQGRDRRVVELGHTSLAQGVGEHVQDIAGALGSGEDPLPAADDGAQPMPLQPLAQSRWGKGLDGAGCEGIHGRVELLQEGVGRSEVGQVTAGIAAHQQFAPGLVLAVDQQAVQACFGTRHRGHQASGASTDDGEVGLRGGVVGWRAACGAVCVAHMVSRPSLVGRLLATTGR